MEIGILIILICVSSYTLLAKRLSTTIVTAPMVFLALGFALSQAHIVDASQIEAVLHVVAEISLIILLFLDASQIDISKLRAQNTLPTRMLMIGLPLCILFGTVLGLIFFPEWPIVLIALIAAILAPTDAALGQSVVTNEKVPERERQTLVVESGLNDGLALPVILFFASLLAVMQTPTDESVNWVVFVSGQIILGPIVGIFMGWTSGKSFILAEKRGLTSHTNQGIGTLALTGSTYLMATLLGGNGFIAAFVAGLVFGNMVKGRCRFLYEFTESEGQMLVWASFLFIGLGLLPEAISHLTWPIAGYILASLFVVRPLAIYLSLLGTQTRFVSRLFLGWFGPRGLATALFALIVAQQIEHDIAESVVIVAINAVWISALLHGITASPLAERYGALFNSEHDKKREEQ